MSASSGPGRRERERRASLWGDFNEGVRHLARWIHPPAAVGCSALYRALVVFLRVVHLVGQSNDYVFTMVNTETD